MASYPAPPSLRSSTPPAHASLPARPPPSAVPPPPAAFKPAFASAGGRGALSGSKPAYNSSFTAFAPRSIASSTFRTNSPTNYSAPPVTSSNSTPQYARQPETYPGQFQYPGQSYEQAPAPQIRNPFIAPSSGLASSINPYGSHAAPIDPEMEAQILQWQSAYVSKDSDVSKPYSFSGNKLGPSGANTAPLGANRTETSTPTQTGPATPSNAESNSKTVYREGGGTQWQDTTLLEWDPAHFRIFVGNLAGEVTDDSLLKAFAKYPSVQKARVVRDKRTTKSRGYGFVSFSDGDEYFQAARDMQGKYIGSHPVLIKKAMTEVKAAPVQQKGKGKHGKNGANGGKVDHAGIQKKQQKTRGGMKILG